MGEYKILLAGKNTAIIDDFFTESNHVFECQTTSVREEDIKSHLRHFYPNLFVYCMRNETTEDMSIIVKLHEDLQKMDVPLGIIANMGEYQDLLRIPDCALELFMQRPISQSQIQAKISHYLKNKSSKRKDDANTTIANLRAGTNNQSTLDLLDKVESEISLMEISQLERTPDQFYADPNYNGKKRILIVDDDANMVKAIKGELEDLYDVSAALSGQLAKRFLKARHVDLILLDYEMPYENGPAVMQYLRAMKETKKIPIIFLTSVNDAAKIQNILSLKPQGYLLKPVDHDTLRQKVREVIG